LEDINKINDGASDSSGDDEGLDPGKSEDLEELSMKKIIEYDHLMTRKLVSLVVASETDDKIPVLAPTSNSTEKSTTTASTEVDPKGVQPTETSKPVVMSISDFPLASCGEHYENKQHSDLYLVFIEYSKDNLAKVKDQFCEDSWRIETNTEIKVASFADKNNANQLAELLRKMLKGVRVSKRQN
jgi:hypothetical protein